MLLSAAPPVRDVSPWLWGAAVTGLGVALPVGLAWAFAHPPRRLHRRTPRHLGIAYARVRLRTEDDVTLSAWYVPPADTSRSVPRGVVVVCHGYYGNRAQMLPHVGFLHRAGYVVLLFDFRAHGWSRGRSSTFGCRETADLRAALDWVAMRPELADLPVAVLGESMGAAAALLVASEDERVRGVVSDSAYARLDHAVEGRLRVLGPLARLVTPPTQRAGERLLGLRCREVAPEEAIVRVAPRPVLLIHGTRDAFILPENAHRLQAAAPENASLWEVPGAAHCRAVAVAPDEYAARVLGFLEHALAAGSGGRAAPQLNDR